MADLDLAWFRLDPPVAWLEARIGWLDEDERARAARLRHPGHRQRYLAAHLRLRQWLGEHLGCAPAAVRFRYGPHGKPELEGAALQFNLSHSGEYALAGAHPGRRLGVDVEVISGRRDCRGLARRFYHPEEVRWLEAQPPARQPQGFTRLWTCKEAWMKADGRGLGAGLSRARVKLDAGPAQLVVQGRNWFVQELTLEPGVAAAVVMETAPAATALRRLG